MKAKIRMVAVLCFGVGIAHAQSTAPSSIGQGASAPTSHRIAAREWGVLAQGGAGVTDDRGDFRFLMAGFHAGVPVTRHLGQGPLSGYLEYAAELFPFWQSYTPVTQRQNCVEIIGQAFAGSLQTSCSAPFSTGGTYTGVSVTPFLLRWNFAGSERWSPWLQGAGGLIWTNHKYPPFGGPTVSSGGITLGTFGNNGPGSDTSVWNFTPQFGVGVHYFTRANRSVDFGANAVHISSASLGDKNPGVNASVQFTLGYTWWK
jgi:lipid A 3-O-deacylase